MAKTYEKAMKELETITRELESGELTLDESLAKYAQAVELIKFCNEKLESAKKQMLVLVESANGEMTEIPFREEEYRG
jgi:exodeoxyribonuclease VII small subunit